MPCKLVFSSLSYNFVMYFGLLSFMKSTATLTVWLVCTSRAEALISVSPNSILAWISRFSEPPEPEPEEGVFFFRSRLMLRDPHCSTPGSVMNWKSKVIAKEIKNYSRRIYVYWHFTSLSSKSEQNIPSTMWLWSRLTGRYLRMTASPRLTDWPARTNLSKTSKHHSSPFWRTSLSEKVDA